MRQQGVAERARRKREHFAIRITSGIERYRGPSAEGVAGNTMAARAVAGTGEADTIVWSAAAGYTAVRVRSSADGACGESSTVG